MNRVWRFQLIPSDKRRVTSGDPEVHEVGNVPQVDGRGIEDLRNGQMEVSRERMVSSDSYTAFDPENTRKKATM